MINKTLKKSIPGLVLLFFSTAIRAQDAAADAGVADNGFYDNFLANGLLVFGLVIIIGAVFALFHLLNVMIKVQQIKIYQENGLDQYLEAVEKPRQNYWENFYKRWTAAVPVEKEQDVMLDHDYDGIQELDNSLPPWWVAMFYVTIAFAVVYFGYYHVLGIGASSSEQYEIQMEQAEEQVQAYLAKQADQIDETNVVMLEDDNDIALGKSVYDANCVACHGAFGEGGVGPNLTDEYWLHGGDIKDVFATIKYGVPEKGMISWKSQLRASDMARVSSYIMTMAGTTPPNPKEPQGEVWKPENQPTAAEPDTTATIGMKQ